MRVLAFGEILYDVYGEEYAIGGAPFNFAIQLNRMIKQDKAVRIISALGNDSLGHKALEFAKSEGIDTSCLQISNEFQTGKAVVFLDNNKMPDYDILENVAWDNIIFNESVKSALQTKYDVFYFNLLSQRMNVSKDTLKAIKNSIQCDFRVFDMTLRKSYYTKEQIQEALSFINVLKINEEEFALIAELFYKDLHDREEILSLIQHDFEIPYIFLTLGKDGAYLQSNNQLFRQESSKNITVVDTVGAGDSFCAALCYGLVNNLKDKEILAFCVEIAGLLVQVKGGTTRCNFESVIKKYF